MKTINELCELYGVSRQTIYNAVKKTGKNVKDLTTKNASGATVFTDSGERELVKYLSKNRKKLTTNDKTLQETVKELSEQLKNKESELVNLTQKLTESEGKTEELNRQLTESKALAEDLTNRLEHAEQRIDVLTQTTATQAITIQNLQATKVPLLAQPDRKPGRIRRAWQALTGKGDTEGS